MALDLTRVLYISPDRNRFDLYGDFKGRQGVTLMPGLSGLEGGAITPITTKGARQHGVTVDGISVDAGVIDFTVALKAAPGRPIAELQAAWQRAWADPLRPGWLCIWKRGSGWWWVPARKADARQVWALDTTKSGYAEYEMSAMIADPAWRTRAQSFLWKAPAVSSDFVPGYLKVFNRGGRKAYGRYVFNGPGTWRFWDSGRFVTLPALKEGEELRLDTTPGKWTLVDNFGINRWAQLGGQRFREFVPPGESKVIEVGIKDGTMDSQVLFTLEPRMEYLP